MPSWRPREALVVLIVSGAILAFFAGPAAAFGAPVAFWRMETLGKTGHTMRDSSTSRSNDGTTTDVRVVDGWDGKGFKFNGNTSRVVVPDDASLDPGSRAIRIVTYAKYRFFASDHKYVLLTKGGAASSRYTVLINAKGWAVCSFSGTSGAASVHSSTRLTRTKRHQIICGKVDRRIWIRVDGVKAITKVEVGSISNTRPVMLGAGSKSINHFLGGLDETTIQIGGA
jgi:hypothetical protein